MALTGYWRGFLLHLSFTYDQPGDKEIRSPIYLGYLSSLGQRGVFKMNSKETEPVAKIIQNLWNDESGQDIAEYAVMLAVILVIVVGTVRLIGSNANNVFSNVGSAIK
jgi:Flp pilus assembly pilin Flp